MIRNHLIFPLLLVAVFLRPLTAEAEPSLPERFSYYVFWSGIRAGSATLYFTRTGDGTSITSNATSASIISLFYKVDDTAKSILYEDGSPKNYHLKIREGRHRREKMASFGERAEDGSQKVVFRNILENETSEFILQSMAHDPLSALYELRKRPLSVGKPEYIDIFESNKLWKTEVQVIKKERIWVPAGEFDTILIKPVMQSEGIFLKKGDMYIWLTDDEKRIPVMIESEGKIGSFKVKLVEGAY
ncbi:MAG: DUF3108 domain-containing protein [Nitrospirae bacterium]|nr:DUF3108 domain-containing protein [Nitrospirota bacterium]